MTDILSAQSEVYDESEDYEGENVAVVSQAEIDSRFATVATPRLSIQVYQSTVIGFILFIQANNGVTECL